MHHSEILLDQWWTVPCLVSVKHNISWGSIFCFRLQILRHALWIFSFFYCKYLAYCLGTLVVFLTWGPSHLITQLDTAGRCRNLSSEKYFVLYFSFLWWSVRPSGNIHPAAPLQPLTCASSWSVLCLLCIRSRCAGLEMQNGRLSMWPTDAEAPAARQKAWVRHKRCMTKECDESGRQQDDMVQFVLSTIGGEKHRSCPVLRSFFVWKAGILSCYSGLVAHLEKVVIVEVVTPFSL